MFLSSKYSSLSEVMTRRQRGPIWTSHGWFKEMSSAHFSHYGCVLIMLLPHNKGALRQRWPTKPPSLNVKGQLVTRILLSLKFLLLSSVGLEHAGWRLNRNRVKSFLSLDSPEIWLNTEDIGHFRVYLIFSNIFFLPYVTRCFCGSARSWIISFKPYTRGPQPQSTRSL